MGHKFTNTFQYNPAEIAKSLDQSFDAETFTKHLFGQIKRMGVKQQQPTANDHPWIDRPG
jgi:hypothetical protein